MRARVGSLRITRSRRPHVPAHPSPAWRAHRPRGRCLAGSGIRRSDRRGPARGGSSFLVHRRAERHGRRARDHHDQGAVRRRSGRHDRTAARPGGRDPADDHRPERLRRRHLDADRCRRVDRQRPRQHRLGRLHVRQRRRHADGHRPPRAEPAPAGGRQQPPGCRHGSHRRAGSHRNAHPLDEHRGRTVDGTAQRALRRHDRHGDPAVDPVDERRHSGAGVLPARLRRAARIDQRRLAAERGRQQAHGGDALAHEPLRRHDDRAAGSPGAGHARGQRGLPDGRQGDQRVDRDGQRRGEPAVEPTVQRHPHHRGELHRQHARIQRVVVAGRQRPAGAHAPMSSRSIRPGSRRGPSPSRSS